jgi:sporulation protein YlmC with PRC-barrel domain
MMRGSVIAAVASLALLATPALAQTTAAPGGAAPGGNSSLGSTPPPAATARPKPDPMHQEDVSEITGAAVYGSDGKKIGSIATVLMRPDTRTIERFVVGAGGVLGVGAHDVALPVSQFHWDAQKGGFVIADTEAQLKAMPAWNGSGGTMSGSSTPPADTSR